MAVNLLSYQLFNLAMIMLFSGKKESRGKHGIERICVYACVSVCACVCLCVPACQSVRLPLSL